MASIMKLFIAEKPSLARAIAEGLGIEKSGKSSIVCRSGAVVTWCFGHLLEQAEPDAYLGGAPQDAPEAIPAEGPGEDAFGRAGRAGEAKGAKRRRAKNAKGARTSGRSGRSGKSGRRPWRLEDLPIFPHKWILEPRGDAGVRAQLAVIGRLLREADSVVNAGDPDREGQLLVDEVLEHFRCRRPVERFWASAIDPESIRRALRSLRPNAAFAGMRDAALGRSRADWLLGMNLSRLYTLREARAGRRRLVVAGRVQTPTLTLVAQRDYAVRNFKPVPYLSILADCVGAGVPFTAKWLPREGQAGLDSEGRLVDLDLGRRLVERLASVREARVVSSETKRKRQAQPRCFSLADIQQAASRRIGLTAERTLAVCQALYEKHKCASYPRTDCQYLPESQRADAPRVLAAITRTIPGAEGICSKADPSIKSPTWNDRKVTAHHGIIPTGESVPWERLSEDERKIYAMIAKRYIAQFLPAYECDATRIVLDVGGESFVASGSVPAVEGWKILYRREIRADRERSRRDEAQAGEPDESQALPRLAKDDRADVLAVRGVQAQTRPPAYYTEGTLIAAMESIHRAFEDPKIRARLKEADGIGTPATRAGIISELKRRKFLVAEGKHLHCSDEGREMLRKVSPRMRSAVLTAQYEEMLGEVEAGRMRLEAFEEQVRAFVRAEIGAEGAGASGPSGSSVGSGGSGAAVSRCQGAQ